MSELKTWGQIAYEAYIKSSGGKSIRGEQLPGWDDQDGAIAQHWEAAGRAVAKLAAPELFTVGIEGAAL